MFIGSYDIVLYKLAILFSVTLPFFLGQLRYLLQPVVKAADQVVVFRIRNKGPALRDNGICRIIRHEQAGSRFFFFIFRNLHKIIVKIIKKRQVSFNVFPIGQTVFGQKNGKLRLNAGGRAEDLFVQEVFRHRERCLQSSFQNIIDQLLFLRQILVRKGGKSRKVILCLRAGTLLRFRAELSEACLGMGNAVFFRFRNQIMQGQSIL